MIFFNSEEFIYGIYYMLRKFKCVVMVLGDNFIDLYI